MTRQKIRKLLLLISFLLFPLVFLHLSPVLPIEAALSDGVINGSLIVFGTMFIGSIFCGRLFCSYVCPGGGLQESVFIVNNKQPKQGRRNNIKYVIWALWILAIMINFIRKGKVFGVNFFWGDSWGGIARIFEGVSPIVSIVFNFTLYYTVISVILIPSLFGGKRAFCHYICWMAPFMVLGAKLRNSLHLPGLHIAKKSNDCISCKKCNNTCPMCIDIESVMKDNEDSAGIYSAECIQCGACVDNCPRKTLKYSFGRTQ